MKKIFCCFFLFLPVLAGAQGMYIPSLLDSTVMADMNAKGCRLTKEEIYSFKNTSLKDGVVLFGGGCTGEMISAEGLLSTNHHCGLGQIQSHSTIEHDYLTNGFWAKSRAEELACPGLTVTFIVNIVDVTDSIVPYLKNTANELARNAIAESVGKKLVTRAVAGTTNTGFVRPFYQANQYFLFVTQIFKDVRLVGAPPISIGNFGGDTDNWMWPRHTGDFSLFRIYADKNNNPAEFAADNVPYKPRHFFPISIKGIKEGDFTMVYGFPGSTQQYLTSYAVDIVANVADPARVEVRTERLQAWDNAMRTNDTVRIQYQSKYNGLSNGWKKWQGEVMGLKQCNVVQLKQDFEQATIARNSAAAALLNTMKTQYDSLRKYQAYGIYTSEALMAPEIFRYAAGWKKTIDWLKTPGHTVTDSLKEALRKNAEGFYKDYDSEADEAVMAAVLPLYVKNVPPAWHPKWLKDEMARRNMASNDAHLPYYTSVGDIARYNYSPSMLDNKKHMLWFIGNLTTKNIKRLEKDPLYQFAISSYVASDIIIMKSSPYAEKLVALNREYMKLLMNTYPDKNFFPDANLTLRVTYGNVKPYKPRNGVNYSWYTTTDGVLEKFYSAAAPDYVIPNDYKTLLEKKDFGDYAENGELHTGFIASNHTTGGNSGSPVLDATGNLIGLNFDRVWEGTMSDIYFDQSRCRNIALDVRYMLFIIDKYGKAGYLLKEMKVVR